MGLGGRVGFLTSVSNSVLIFYLAFLKMTERVVKKIVHIQREFL